MKPTLEGFDRLNAAWRLRDRGMLADARASANLAFVRGARWDDVARLIRQLDRDAESPIPTPIV